MKLNLFLYEMHSNLVRSVLEYIQQPIGKTSSYSILEGTILSTSQVISTFVRHNVDSIFPRHIDMTNAGVPELVRLLSSCTTLGEEDVLGEGFRKAGKLGEFAVKFDPSRSGILDVAAKELLDVERGEVEAELEGFYVYGGLTSYFAVGEKLKTVGKGSSTKMESTDLGMLVIVFPTVYEGGNLVVLKEDEKWCFDPAKVLADKPKPSIAYAASTSGISLEVSAGHLCMLVYRIIKKPNYTGIQPTTYESEEKFKTALSALLADSEFIPNGGFLGFGLKHKYPNMSKSIKGMKKKLVGQDSLVQRVCRDLGLKVSLRVMYDDDDPSEIQIMMKEPADLTKWCGASFGLSIVDALKEEGGVDLDLDDTDLRWVEPYTAGSEIQTSYSGYGHKATVRTLYGWVRLMVEIPNAGARVKGGGPMKQDDSSDDE
jgi:hypothetical protein